nr:nickel insertion protein [Arsenicicoccus piscis]
MCWIDASCGVAGDMLLAALLDAGADLAAVQAAVDAVVPGLVTIEVAEVQRGGLRATKAVVRPTADEQHHRAWSSIEAALQAADLPEDVRERAQRVFARLAEAEGRAHGVAPADVHFHEIGAWDSIGDIVAVCAALASLDVDTLTVGPIAVGSGRVRMEHGELAVPGPARRRAVPRPPGRPRSGGHGARDTHRSGAALRRTAGRRDARNHGARQRDRRGRQGLRHARQRRAGGPGRGCRGHGSGRGG